MLWSLATVGLIGLMVGAKLSIVAVIVVGFASVAVLSFLGIPTGADALTVLAFLAALIVFYNIAVVSGLWLRYAGVLTTRVSRNEKVASGNAGTVRPADRIA